MIISIILVGEYYYDFTANWSVTQKCKNHKSLVAQQPQIIPGLK